MVWYGMVLYCTAWHGMVLYCIVLYCIVQHGMAWYGTVLYGMVWYLWHGMALTCLRRYLAAQSSGVHPRLSASSTSAPAARRTLGHGYLIFAMGVLDGWTSSKLLLLRYLTWLVWPNTVARKSGVQPSLRRRGFTSAPALGQACQRCRGAGVQGESCTGGGDDLRSASEDSVALEEARL